MSCDTKWGSNRSGKFEISRFANGLRHIAVGETIIFTERVVAHEIMASSVQNLNRKGFIEIEYVVKIENPPQETTHAHSINRHILSITKK